MMDTIEAMLAARSAERGWQIYISRLSMLGFPHVSYHAVRLLSSDNGQMIDDSILLSSHATRLIDELLSENLLQNSPMYRWIERHTGSESWAWMQARYRAGRLSAEDERAMELFARHGYSAGYAISLGDKVQRLRGGVILNGPVGSRQERLDGFWRQHRREIEALTGILHLRLANLPFNQPEEVLTLRQREVLECISVGQTTQEIAAILDVTQATVEKHLRLARKSLGARTTAQAILLACNRRQIFIDPGEPCTENMQWPQSDPKRPPAEAWRFTSFPPVGVLQRDRSSRGSAPLPEN